MRDYGARISAELKALPGVGPVASASAATPPATTAGGRSAASSTSTWRRAWARRRSSDVADQVLERPRAAIPACSRRCARASTPARTTSDRRAGADQRLRPGPRCAGRRRRPDRRGHEGACRAHASVQVFEDQARAPVVRVDLNFQRLALYGLSAADVLDTVQAAFAGERVAQIYEDGRVVDLAVSAQACLRRDPETVGDLLLRSTSGISGAAEDGRQRLPDRRPRHDRPRRRAAPPGDHRRRQPTPAGSSARRAGPSPPMSPCRRAPSSSSPAPTRPWRRRERDC